MRRPTVAHERREVADGFSKPTILFTVSCAGYSLHVRCPATSSCAFVDHWTLPDPRKKDHGVIEAMLTKMLALTRAERVCVKMMVESRDSLMLSVLHWHGFKTNTRIGLMTELVNDFSRKATD